MSINRTIISYFSLRFTLNSYFFLEKQEMKYVIVFALNKFGLVLNGCKIVQYLKNENCVVFYTDTNKYAKGGVLFWKISSSSLFPSIKWKILMEWTSDINLPWEIDFVCCDGVQQIMFSCLIVKAYLSLSSQCPCPTCPKSN